MAVVTSGYQTAIAISGELLNIKEVPGIEEVLVVV